MHIKNIHCMIEKLSECTKSAIENNQDHIGTFYIPDIVDMIKDLCCAEKDARIAKSMEKEEEEEKEEEKYMLKMLKEEHGMSDEDSKRFYDAWRYKSSGRFAPKGRGTRRGYEEPPYYHMTPEMMREHDPEYWRDVDREQGRLYFSSPMGGNMSGGNSSGNSDVSGNSTSGNTRSYTEGYNDGNRRGYEDGYRDGESRGRSQGGNSRYERAKRGYEETKEKHKGNTPEDKRMNMAEFEKVLNIVLDEIDDMLEDAPPEMKNMAKTKGMARLQKIS